VRDEQDREDTPPSDAVIPPDSSAHRSTISTSLPGPAIPSVSRFPMTSLDACGNSTQRLTERSTRANHRPSC
jgi:hypothetical protein